jgi:hypothetical protein
MSSIVIEIRQWFCDRYVADERCEVTVKTVGEAGRDFGLPEGWVYVDSLPNGRQHRSHYCSEAHAREHADSLLRPQRSWAATPYEELVQ